MNLCKQHTSHGKEHRYFRKMGVKKQVECRTKYQFRIIDYSDANMLALVEFELLSVDFVY